MEKRILGDGFEVSAIGLGCMGFTHAYGDPMPEDDVIAAMRAAYDAGYTFFDTAEAYIAPDRHGGTIYNETILGKALSPVRDKVQIATKYGVTHAGRDLRVDSSPATMRSSLEASLKRLGTDHVDLYYQHRIDPDVEPEVVAETMGEFIREGKVLHWGISEATEEYLRRAHAVTPVCCIQNRYSMMARWYESLFPTLEELGVGFVAFSPLANGVLSGNFQTSQDGNYSANDFRGTMPQYSKEAQEKNGALYELLRELAQEKRATEAQISLAWMLAQRPWIVPIPGSRKVSRIQENAKAASIELTAQEIARINELLDATEFEVYGGVKTIK